MNCENCSKEHDGTYGSSRFCSVVCARSFSTKKNRDEINKKVSEKMKGILPKNSRPFKKGRRWNGHIFSEKDRVLAVQNRIRFLTDRLAVTPFHELSKRVRKRFLIQERGHKCEKCGGTKWLSGLIPLEEHHVDGDKTNNTKTNLLLMCPNCHTLTDNYKSKNKKKRT